MPYQSPFGGATGHVVLSASGHGTSFQAYGPADGTPPYGPDWPCDPTKGYLFGFYHESEHLADVVTNGWAGWDPVECDGMRAYGVGRDLYMEGAVHPFDTQFFTLGGGQELLYPIVHASVTWTFPTGTIGTVETGRPFWQFEVFEVWPTLPGPSTPGEPCPPSPPWPYNDQVSVTTRGGVIGHRRIIGARR